MDSIQSSEVKGTTWVSVIPTPKRERFGIGFDHLVFSKIHFQGKPSSNFRQHFQLGMFLHPVVNRQ